MPIILESTASVASPTIPGLVTLAQLEQEKARRCGPYFQAYTDRQIPNTANFGYAVVPALRSSIDLDSATNLWVLRRGTNLNGQTVVVDVGDRQRLVSEYDPSQGRIYVDYPWGAVPLPGEILEFGHLNPSEELRVAVQAGLRRCFFDDTITITPSGSDWWSGVDVTAQAPWLVSPDQIVSVRYGWGYPYLHVPYDAYTVGGHVIVSGTSLVGYSPSGVYLEAERPAWSHVNGADSTTGPVADADQLDLDLDYMASAAHIEAWHHFPSRMQAAAAGGLQATQAMAAAEFSRQALIWNPAPPRSLEFSSPVGIRL